MSCLGTCCRCNAILVAIFAILVGVLWSGVPSQMGLFSSFDSMLDANGNNENMGMLPAYHVGTPWEFHLEDLKKGSLTGNVYVVTGANVGLGYWTTRHLASHGGTVVMACRSTQRCETARSAILADLKGSDGVGQLACLNLDLSSLRSVKAFATDFHSKYKALHSLVLNAGIMMPPFGLTEDGIERQIGVNHVGHFYLTQLLQDTLVATADKQKSPTTVAVVSSAAQFKTYPEDGIRLTLEQWNNASGYDPLMAYGQSKLANILFVQELSKRLKKHNVLVNAAHPGVVATDLGRHLIDGARKALPPVVAKYVIKGFVAVFENMAWHPRDAALTQLYTAVGPSLLKKGTTGKYFHPIAREAKPDVRFASNLSLQTGLWELTERLVAERVSKF